MQQSRRVCRASPSGRRRTCLRAEEPARPQNQREPPAPPPDAQLLREELGLCHEAANRLLSCQHGDHSSGYNPMTSGGDCHRPANAEQRAHPPRVPSNWEGASVLQKLSLWTQPDAAGSQRSHRILLLQTRPQPQGDTQCTWCCSACMHTHAQTCTCAHAHTPHKTQTHVHGTHVCDTCTQGHTHMCWQDRPA